MNSAEIPGHHTKLQNQETNRSKYRPEGNRPTMTTADVKRDPDLYTPQLVALLLSNLHNTLNVLHVKIGESASLLRSASISEITAYISEFTVHFKLYLEAAFQHIEYLKNLGLEHQREFYEKLRLRHLHESAKLQVNLVNRQAILLKNVK